MSKHRRAARTDNNQNEIVDALRKIHGITVELNHDDILLGYKKKTYWFEIKNSDAVSKKTGEILNSKIKQSQHKLKAEWTGHYSIVSSLDEILAEVNIKE